MTCYLTDRTSPEEVEAAKEVGVVAYKLYPAGAPLVRCFPASDMMRTAHRRFTICTHEDPSA